MSTKADPKRGIQILTLQGLAVARTERRAVYCPSLPSCKKPKPAAWVINMNGSVILRMIDAGLYVYEKDGTEHADEE